MLYLLIAVLGILFTILFVIGTHEAAHFLTARLLNIKVLRFSIGFGKTLFSWRDKKNTEYVFALIPLGGYVKMLDERESAVPAHEVHLAFNRQPFYKKFLVVLAGPVANLFCAFVLYWLIFIVGFVTIKPVIGEIIPQSIAATAGLQPNQEIIRLDGKSTWTWTNIVLNLLAHIGNKKNIDIEVKNLDSHVTQTYTLNLSAWQIDGLKPEPLKSLGIVPYQPAIPLIIGAMDAHSPAAHSPLKLGDKILAINNRPVKNWDDTIEIIMQHPDKTLIFTIKRQNKLLDLPVTIGAKRHLMWRKYGYLGIGPKINWPAEMQKEIKYGPIQAIGYAWEEMVNFTYFNFLLFGKILTGKLSLQSLGGPITIFETAGSAINYGFLPFISFLAFLSVSIGFINLLPIPGLDGGHLVIETIEFVIRKPLPIKLLETLYKVGFLLIFFLLLQALINDFLRL